jgi:preprotein translocase subunit SecE
MLERIRHSLSETADELLNKVTWPSWEELQQSAIVTLIASLFIALIVAGMDGVFKFIFEQVYKMV